MKYPFVGHGLTQIFLGVVFPSATAFLYPLNLIRSTKASTTSLDQKPWTRTYMMRVGRDKKCRNPKVKAESASGTHYTDTDVKPDANSGASFSGMPKRHYIPLRHDGGVRQTTAR